LRQAFLSADPASVAGADVTVRDVLDTALPTLELSFDTHPELYASLAGTIAEVQLKLGLSTPSAQLFDRAADAASRSRIGAQEHFDLLVLRARALHGAGEYERAKLSLDEALALGVRPNAEWKVVKAASLHQDRDFNAAVDLLREANETLQLRPADDEWYYTGRIRLAQSLQNLAAHDEALAVMQETIDHQQRALGDDHPRVALTRLHLLMGKQQMGLSAEVLDEARTVHAQISRIFGADSTITAKAAMVQGNALSSQGLYADAATLNRQVLAIFDSNLGEAHPNTLKAAYNLAAMLALEPQTRPEALTIMRRTVRTAELKLGAESKLATFFRDEYVGMLLDNGEMELALATITGPESVAGLPDRTSKSAAKALGLLQRAQEPVCEESALPPAEPCLRASRQIAQLRTLIDAQ
jgi:serine/threonine-protein kinase